ncbi:hypothetical protein HX033_16095 [Myroides odoratimimus]|uniref:hypothetical protein n=1 Tax=Myroides odoratimimus TaxID=76832 RepID=UPI0025756D3F|nr:hypothetical protein [Myroides odoratimimus]MDM1402192.1 hypothetical protein [Myroides odoratimimus]MEC4036574.1 hypothetical protein [Myroides odoratimimus]
MTELDFFEKINKHRDWCKDLAEGNGGFNIQRGQAKVMSGYVEDLFALYIAKKINRQDLQFLVDKTTSLRFSKNGRATTFKPDVSIITSDNILTEYYDLKTNLGWNRDIEKYIKKKSEFISKIRGRKGWIHFSKDNIQEITFSEKLKYKMVVIHGWNINEKQLNRNIEVVKEFDNVELYILYDHYNKRNNIEDFNRLYDFESLDK